MKRIVTQTTETFDAGSGFRMDVVITSDCYEAWIYHESIGIKVLMFGLPKDQQTYKKAVEIMKDNFTGYISDYTDEYMKGE